MRKGLLSFLILISILSQATSSSADNCGKQAGDDGGWVPPNKVRNLDKPPVQPAPPELPGFLDPQAGITRHGIVFGPNCKFQAAFNPAAWVQTDPTDGKEKVFMIIRGEEEHNDRAWKRQSLPYLATSEDGLHFKLVSEKPVLEATEPYEAQGGLEDFRFADFSRKPVVDQDGKVFTKGLYYTAFDGKTARICLALFNDMSDIRKVGPIFKDADVLKNPSVPGSPWNKSPAFVQYTYRGKLHQVGFWNEGNESYGGIWSTEITDPRAWPYPTDPSRGPVVRSRPGKYDQNLVESAFEPIVGPLPDWLAKKTGQKQGLYLCLHGDSPPRGYQVGFRVFSLDNPTGPPIYESDGPFFWPKEKYEIQGQVDKVVFMSSAVRFHGLWWFYYGAGDRVIGAATGVPALRSN